MTATQFVQPDEIRSRFSKAMSDMYKKEVPQYGTLLELVTDINEQTLKADTTLRESLERSGEIERIDLERHGAIRLGSARELAMMRRIFQVFGMHAVGYYDLSVAGVPVHATAFRPVEDESLRRNPFRVFTSLLRLELIEDDLLREQARQILNQRQIFSDLTVALVDQCERDGGLLESEANRFVSEVLNTFRWHRDATVDAQTYHKLLSAHRLIADIVCFKGPHINHLTPRTLDIDASQIAMPLRGIKAKDVVEGPPRRTCPILLRQTSFKALEEAIVFKADSDQGTHTARFGEIEQRGVALTPKGRALYDELLGGVRSIDGLGSAATDYATRLEFAFQAFPDDHLSLHEQGLAYYRFSVKDPDAFDRQARSGIDFNVSALVCAGTVELMPIVYEDFLPVSAAGIFQSNLGGCEQREYSANAAQSAFEQALGCEVLNEFSIYEASQQRSLDELKSAYERKQLPSTQN